MKNLILMSLTLITFLGCGKETSNYVDTHTMYLAMSLINQDSSSIECYTRISLIDPLGASVQLVDGDYLTCNGQRMKRHESLGEYVYYSKRISIRSGEPVTITLQRKTERFDSTILAPTPVEIESPTSLNFAYSDDVVIRWKKSSQPNETLHAELAAYLPVDPLKSSFIFSTQTQRPETGQLTLASLNSQSSLPLNAPAPVKLTLYRTLDGTVATSVSGHFSAKSAPVEVTGIVTP